MPVMNTDGTNTAHSTTAIAISAEPTSSMLLRAASRGANPAAMLRSTFSTTTMASSTTMPMAKTSPNNDRLFKLNPRAAMTANVPMSDTGTAIMGMMVARQFCRNTKTTIRTRMIASNSVLYTSWIDSLTNTVVSYAM